MLSGDSQSHLKTLLPATAFTNYLEALGSDHPSIDNDMNIDKPPDTDQTDAELNLSIFSDPHFLAASRTFQDHLYLGWFSAAHREKVKDFQESVENGTLAAPWKDEVWNREHRTFEEQLSPGKHDAEAKTSLTVCESSAKAGYDRVLLTILQGFLLIYYRLNRGVTQIKLQTLVKNGIIRVGDVLAYKRSFANAETIEKDTIVWFFFCFSLINFSIFLQVEAIHPTTFDLTVLTQPGQEKDLPSHLLSRDPLEPSAPTRSMTNHTLSMLETGILDIDGRLRKAQRPNGNAWKCFTVWRWRAGSDCVQNSRGGRENYGTLFYIRGSYYHEHGSR